MRRWRWFTSLLLVNIPALPTVRAFRRSYKKDDQVTTFLSRTSWWHNYTQNIECVWKLSDSCTGDYCVAQHSSNHASRSLMCPRAVVRCVARYLDHLRRDSVLKYCSTIITALADAERRNLKLAFGKTQWSLQVVCACILYSRSTA
jgi:hypothetical protein